MKLGSRDISLFSHSFLGLGSTEIVNRFKEESSCMPQNYPLTTGFGQGNGFACASLIANSINQYDNVSMRVGQLVANNQIDHWYMLGSISSMIKKQPFVFSNDATTAQSVLNQGHNEVCQRQWSDLVAQYPLDEYMKNNCLISSYYYALTVNGYGFNAEQQVSVMPTVDETDWTLGVLVSILRVSGLH